MKIRANPQAPHSETSRHHLRKLLTQFVSYVAVGGVAFVVDLGTLYLLTEFFGIYYIASATAGFLLGLIVNYLLCVIWIFDFRAIEKAAHEFGLFAAIGIVGLLLNNLLIYLLTEFVGIHYVISKMIAAALVLVFNFALRRQLLFSNNRYARRLSGRSAVENL